MPENILEHTTSIAGLTCKPLTILSETISPQEMSMARGGDGMGGGGPGSMSSGQDPAEAKSEKRFWKRTGQKTSEEQTQPKDKPGLGPLGGTYIPKIDVAGSPNEETFWTQSNVDTTAQADSSGTQDLNGGTLDIWDFDFLDEDECTVPYDCGDDEEEEDYSEEETEEDTVVYDP